MPPVCFNAPEWYIAVKSELHYAKSQQSASFKSVDRKACWAAHRDEARGNSLWTLFSLLDQ